ncbi:MAG: NrfD/PsrC family molybdoenzyme membrane anchor subunit [Acidobacteriota bacterium]
MLLHEMPFGWPVVAYLSCAGLAAGAALGAALDLRGEHRRRAQHGYLVASVAILIGALFLIVDLEKPASFAAVLLHFNPASAISWGARALPLFALSCLFAGWLLRRDRRHARPFQAVATGLGLFIAAYPGVVLYQALGRPLWHNPILVPLLFVSALHMGLAARRWIGSRSSLAGEGWLLGLQLTLLVAWLITASGQAPGAVVRLTAGSLAPWLWVGVVAVGLITPWWAIRHRGAQRFALGIAPILGGIALRAIVILGGQGVDGVA